MPIYNVSNLRHGCGYEIRDPSDSQMKKWENSKINADFMSGKKWEKRSKLSKKKRGQADSV